MFAGSCSQQKVLDNAFDLSVIKTKYDTGSETPYGRNFNFVENDSAWMTGMRFYRNDMFISNRGNGNFLDSNNVKLFRLGVTKSAGAPDQTLDLGTSTFTSIDGFDLAGNGTNLLIAAFHGVGGVRSGTLATAFDLTSTFTATGSLKSSGGNGVRACSWGNSGNKYYMGYGTGTNVSTIRQFTAATAYQTASGDTEGTAKSLTFNNVSDITFNPDGTKMYVSEHDGNLHQFTLTTAWDTSTAGSQVTVDVSDFFFANDESNIYKSPSRATTDTDTTQWICGMHWNEDGTKLFINSLWGATKSSAVNGSPNPLTVQGTNNSYNGTVVRDNTFAVIEFSVN